jgi:hypothetical protein
MGKLVQVNTATVTSATPSVTLTGIDSDDVYMVAYNDWKCDTNIVQNKIRITKSGSPDVTANYDFASKLMYATTTFGNNSGTNQTEVGQDFIGTGTGEASNGVLYLYNFNSSSEYSFITQEEVNYSHNPRLTGIAGGIVHTVASASDGIHFFMTSGNITSGTFTLYKVL